jgi:uncharacterized protein (DUF1499 family)
MGALKWIFWVGLLLAVVVLIAGHLGLLSGKPPQNLGAKDGRLKPPSRTPNSVSSQADLYPEHEQREYARIEPLPMKGDAAASIARLKTVLEGMAGLRIVSTGPDYLYAHCTTKLLKYVDDLEFWADASAGVVHVRSASRLGRKDFGVNRARVEAIRARYLAA